MFRPLSQINRSPKIRIFRALTRISSISIAISISTLTYAQTMAEPSAKKQQSFAECKVSLAEIAFQQGVSETRIAAEIPNLTQVPKVLDYDRNQPEFVQTFPSYYSARVNTWRIEKGREALTKNKNFLAELTKRYGIPGHYLLAFWGLETNFGNYKGKMSTLDSLATLACDPRRSDYFTGELMLALKLMDRESLSKEQMIGSWAGAMGHTQFMPTAYTKYAIDGDGDGKADLWNSEKDALTSAANFLNKLGWKPGLRWGREVLLPSDFNYANVTNKKKPISHWADLHITKADGTTVGQSDIPSKLIVPAGYKGPAFLTYHNFNIILRWNNSEFYGIAVGQLANRILGNDELSKPLPELPKYSISQMAQMQRKLNSIDIDVGGADGIIGPATRAGIREFQGRNNMVADGFPSTETFNAILAF
ncbi:membrane-bound lytic murein transglycosylase B [Glaciecola pallidula DSM 14239 = ACAM 615]|uniref:Membrane-bound lytic murein transglycosylase B n=2 Tax=Brumicola TaxID=3160924 RepID=K6Y7R2_9ALTE|nr:membrane-bound lytic murein transglycosylase B [Glaciecola pallidula DSM 14239 = ACAM 615]